MPIRIDSLKQDLTYNHIALKGTATWSIAVAALQQRNGQSNWPLVVLKSDGTFSAAAFNKIIASGDIPPDTAIETITSLKPVETIDVNSMSTGEAKNKADNFSKLYVITENGKYKYIVGKIERGGGDLPSGKLGELAGKTADLSKLGDFLLDE
ncbi:MAG: hypothetical protein HYZ49_18035 [Chloroflexi bacterium]|nr:hypothetical protein [Chloroflexota bacterium]